MRTPELFTQSSKPEEQFSTNLFICAHIGKHVVCSAFLCKDKAVSRTSLFRFHSFFVKLVPVARSPKSGKSSLYRRWETRALQSRVFDSCLKASSFQDGSFFFFNFFSQAWWERWRRVQPAGGVLLLQSCYLLILSSRVSVGDLLRVFHPRYWYYYIVACASCVQLMASCIWNKVCWL